MAPLLLAVASAASILLAHGDTGVLELVSTTPVDESTVTYVVELTYENDGDPISQAEVVVAADDLAPQTMAPLGDGRYEATIAFPGAGDYDVTFTVDQPEAELVVEQVVDPPATTTTEATDDAPSTTTAEQPRTREEAAEEAGSAWWLLIVMGAFVVAMVVIAVAYFRGRRQPSQ